MEEMPGQAGHNEEGGGYDGELSAQIKNLLHLRLGEEGPEGERAGHGTEAALPFGQIGEMALLAVVYEVIAGVPVRVFQFLVEDDEMERLDDGATSVVSKVAVDDLFLARPMRKVHLWQGLRG